MRNPGTAAVVLGLVYFQRVVFGYCSYSRVAHFCLFFWPCLSCVFSGYDSGVCVCSHGVLHFSWIAAHIFAALLTFPLFLLWAIAYFASISPLDCLGDFLGFVFFFVFCWGVGV